jgi:hypothetical protein
MAFDIAFYRPWWPKLSRVACSVADVGGGDAKPRWLLAVCKNTGHVACGMLAAWAIASTSNPVIAASQVGGFLLRSLLPP